MDRIIDLSSTTLRKWGLLFAFLFVSSFIHAQLSDLHYLPPLKQGQNNAGIRDQAIYLSTPEPTSFTVNAYRGTNATPEATFNISNVSPAVWTLGDGDNNITLVNNANTGVVLNNSGLRFESPSGNRFYVNYRGNSSAQAASLTAKGRQALGTRFKWGGVPNLGAHPSKSNTLGIMATEDNTTVQLYGYGPGCEFRVGNDRAGITANTYTVTLDANESFVFETYIGKVAAETLRFSSKTETCSAIFRNCLMFPGHRYFKSKSIAFSSKRMVGILYFCPKSDANLRNNR